MNSKERLLAAWNGRPQDHIPLCASCFGVQPPPRLRWARGGREVRYWYTGRLEYIHTLPEPWSLDDDFQRARAWLSLGVDDILDVSVPWSADPGVTWRDAVLPAEEGQAGRVLARDYSTPHGKLRHAVVQTGEERGGGWVLQPDYVPLFEDYNLPRAVRQAVADPADIPLIADLYQPPDAEARAGFAARMGRVQAFTRQFPVAVQAWSAFGMDAAVWLMGGVQAVMAAVDTPDAFGQLVEIIFETDYGRTELAATSDGVDMVVQRGWYSSTDFWSPKMFDRFIFPYLREISALAHRQGKKFGYVMTTGVERLGPRLADAGVDVLYFVDPLQDGLALERARDLLGGRMTLAGGINALSLSSGDPARISREVEAAVEILGPTQRFILQPVDALFPDTPWEGVAELIAAWKSAQGL